MGGDRFIRTLAVAATLHSVVVLTVGATLRPLRRHPATASPIVESWLPVDVVVPASPPRANAVDAPPSVVAHDRHVESPSLGIAPGVSRAPPRRQEPDSVVTTSSTPSTWSFSPLSTRGRAPADVLSSAVTGPAVAAVIAADESRREVSRGQRVVPHDDAKDDDLGLVPGGELVNPVRDAVRNSLTPTSGHAVLEFGVDGDGRIASVRVADASSGRREWDAVAAELAATRTGGSPRVRVPSWLAKGFVVTVEVTSALKSADGAISNGKTGAAEAIGSILGAIVDPLDTKASSTLKGSFAPSTAA